jgi:hypothetical protein
VILDSVRNVVACRLHVARNVFAAGLHYFCKRMLACNCLKFHLFMIT